MKKNAAAFVIGAGIATVVSFPWARETIGQAGAIVMDLLIWMLFVVAIRCEWFKSDK